MLDLDQNSAALEVDSFLGAEPDFLAGFGYPLAALVGQEDMFQALILLAVDPYLGGLLLVGEKGTAKSTAARALAEILPSFLARDCPYHCRPDKPSEMCLDCQSHEGPGLIIRPPFKTVPLGVTEERLLGGLDWESTLKGGRLLLKPGLLGQANYGLLYVDEINLLEPSLAHLLLDAVSSGRVVVEREGLSLWHPSKVALLGSMNPEEGPLGPQLADRFALTVTLKGESDPIKRTEIVRRRLAYERDPQGFRQAYAAQSTLLTERLRRARVILTFLCPATKTTALAVHLSQEVRAAGHRADLALCRTSMALAAWELAEQPERLDQVGPLTLIQVEPSYLERIVHLVLPFRERHKLRVNEKTVIGEVKKVVHQDEIREDSYFIADQVDIPPDYNPESFSPLDKTVLTVFEVAQTFDFISPKSAKEKGPKERSGRRSWRETLKARGRAFKTTARRLGRPVSLSATLRAAAPYQSFRRHQSQQNQPILDTLYHESTPQSKGSAFILNPADFREKVYRLKTGRLVLFVVDSSGSIGTLYRMEEAKAAALSLLADAYRKRDRVAVIAFYGHTAELLLPPTNSPDLAGRLLASLPSGGKTPLAAALALTHKLITVERSKDPKLSPYVILMTDGRPNIPLDPARSPWPEVLSMAARMADDPTVRFLLIDTDRGAYNDYKLTRELAERLRCPRMSLEELRLGHLDKWLESN
ncbi:MAG: VWA domain-containing protein [Deltaproteobacteria bacterium]|jgi:magnesium chelatase subunit D|nr:VWA domain-containing protein [Deltaproteobacteria bacterium]